MARATSFFYRTFDLNIFHYHKNRFGWRAIATYPARLLGGLILGAPTHVIARLFLTMLNPKAWRDNTPKALLTTFTFGGAGAAAYFQLNTFTTLAASLNGIVPGLVWVGAMGVMALAVGLVVAKTLAQGYHRFTTRHTLQTSNPRYAPMMPSLPFLKEDKTIEPFYNAIKDGVALRRKVKDHYLQYQTQALVKEMPTSNRSIWADDPQKNYERGEGWLREQKEAMLTVYEMSRYDGMSNDLLLGHKRLEEAKKLAAAVSVKFTSVYGRDAAHQKYIPVKGTDRIDFEQSTDPKGCFGGFPLQVKIERPRSSL